MSTKFSDSGGVMLVKYCFISITWEELVDGVTLQIEMKKPKVGSYKEPTEAEVKRVVDAYAKIRKLTVKKYSWSTTIDFNAQLQ
jgi:hypothetical protein